MRTLIVFLMICGLSYGQSIMKDGEVMEILPRDFFVDWDLDEEESVSFFYRAESHDDAHRIFRGEFEAGDEPLRKQISKNPKDKNEMVWFVPIVKHKNSVVLIVYFHKVPNKMKFDLVRMYIAWKEGGAIALVPSRIFPNPEGTIDGFTFYMINNVGEWLTFTKGQIR